jgi:hypothetical protein
VVDQVEEYVYDPRCKGKDDELGAPTDAGEEEGKNRPVGGKETAEEGEEWHVYMGMGETRYKGWVGQM